MAVCSSTWTASLPLTCHFITAGEADEREPDSLAPELELLAPAAGGVPCELCVALPPGDTHGAWRSVFVLSTSRTVELYAGRSPEACEYVSSTRATEKYGETGLWTVVCVAPEDAPPAPFLRLRLLSLREPGRLLLRAVRVHVRASSAPLSTEPSPSQSDQLMAMLARGGLGALAAASRLGSAPPAAVTARVAALEVKLLSTPDGDGSSLEARVTALETRLALLEAGIDARLRRLEQASTIV